MKNTLKSRNSRDLAIVREGGYLQFRNLIFVSGKGGTGKSTVAVLLARQLSQSGKRTLLVELSERSSLQSFLQLSVSPSYKPHPTPWGFDLALVTGRDCLLEYVGHFLKAERLTRQVFENNLIKALVNVAPGLNDLALLGKLTSHHRQHGPSWVYDHLIVDAPSTGSFYSLLAAPRQLGESVSRGPLHTQSEGIERTLKAPQLTQYFFVGLAEELPTDELLETWAQMEGHYPGQSQVIINKFLPLQEARLPEDAWRDYLNRRLQAQAEQMARVQQRVGRVTQLPWLFQGLRETLESSRPLELQWL